MLRSLVALALGFSFVVAAQTSGGSLGSGGLTGGSRESGSSGSGSTGSTGSRTTGSSGFGSSGSTESRRPSTPSTSARDAAERQARDDFFRSQHREAGAPLITPEEQASIQQVPVTLASPFKSTRRGRQSFNEFFGFILATILGFFAFILSSELFERVTFQRPEFLKPRFATFSRVTMAFDWNARPALQGVLKMLAETPIETDRQRRDLVAELANELQTHSRSARYLHVKQVHGSPDEIERLLRDEASGLRARYSVETVGRSRKAVRVFARPIEGKGLLVVSVLLGYTHKLPLRHAWSSVDQSLRSLRTGPPVQMLEVVWSPSEDNDRLSSAELEVLYPELEPLDARLGRTSCQSCAAVYALELEKCPSCGSTDAVRVKGPGAPSCPYCGVAMPGHETQCQSCNAFVVPQPTERAG